MKKQALLCAFLLAVSMAAVSTSFAGKQDFTLVNRTGATLYNLYISASSTDDWEEDVLDDQVLSSGSRRTIRFSDYETRRYWDIKVVDAYGNSVVLKRVDLLRFSTITVYRYNGRIRANFR